MATRNPTPSSAAIVPGTLELLALKAISLGREHGYGVLLRIQQASAGALQVEQGALYPALARLERQGLVASEWGLSGNNRRAKFYALTAAGRQRLKADTADWQRLVEAMRRVLDTDSLEAIPC
ncbi:MAG: PadR family transcriptional regulator [Lysobacteraceae bacterium]|nr:PadR family transcriptional regulator [Xanthomonadales bacterium]HRY01279.1 PadR family transcriptional regulator [Xanthomonadaceae bacterium]